MTPVNYSGFCLYIYGNDESYDANVKLLKNMNNLHTASQATRLIWTIFIFFGLIAHQWTKKRAQNKKYDAYTIRSSQGG